MSTLLTDEELINVIDNILSSPTEIKDKLFYDLVTTQKEAYALVEKIRIVSMWKTFFKRSTSPYTFVDFENWADSIISNLRDEQGKK